MTCLVDQQQVLISILQKVSGELRCRITEMKLPNKIQCLLFSALALYRRGNKLPKKSKSMELARQP
jgi:hypothetical protein